MIVDAFADVVGTALVDSVVVVVKTVVVAVVVVKPVESKRYTQY